MEAVMRLFAYATRARPDKEPARQEPPGLAHQAHILDRVAADLAQAGLVGETRAAKLVYLVLTSRFLERPLCAVIKGQSSAGKSYLVDRVKELFPDSAYHFVTSISPKALAYSEEPLAHRILVIAEAAGFRKGDDALLLRSLVSEGRIHHETVDKDGKALTLDKEGPTGLLVTTTEHRLEPELETRMFSIPINDTAEQTTAIMLATAGQWEGSSEVVPVNNEEWRALQEWLESAAHRVLIPYAKNLAQLMQPVAARMRRDTNGLMGLIATHALLHQAQRGKDSAGRIIATTEDYRAVYGLVVDLVSQGVGASVSAEVRDTVEAVRELLRLREYKDSGVPQHAIAKLRELDKGTVSKRVNDAVGLGYLTNEEWRPRQTAKLKLGEPLPDEVQVLPTPEQLAAGLLNS
jgi:hypothetical protein